MERRRSKGRKEDKRWEGNIFGRKASGRAAWEKRGQEERKTGETGLGRRKDQEQNIMNGMYENTTRHSSLK